MGLKRLLFISPYNSDNNVLQNNGVIKKLFLQLKTFRKLGFAVDYLEINNSSVYLNRDDKRILITPWEHSHHKTMQKVYLILSKTNCFDITYDYIYIRYDHISFRMLRFLKDVKKGDIRILAELPTFMNKWEPGTSMEDKFAFIIKRIMDKCLPKTIDAFVTFSGHLKLFGIRAIPIENFVDVNSIQVIKREYIAKKTINLIGVAQLTPSHGYDRIIRGLNNYYRQNPKSDIEINFHIVGDGSVKKKWEFITNKLNLGNHVIFHGLKGGKELDDLFIKSDIAVASLAMFRKGTEKCSELKIREYCARGIPFVYSAKEPILEDKNFCLKVCHDESPINIQKIIEFYKEMSQIDVSSEMRKFAEQNCTCESQLIKVFNHPLVKNENSFK